MQNQLKKAFQKVKRKQTHQCLQPVMVMVMVVAVGGLLNYTDQAFRAMHPTEDDHIQTAENNDLDPLEIKTIDPVQLLMDGNLPTKKRRHHPRQELTRPPFVPVNCLVPQVVQCRIGHQLQIW